MPDLPISGLSSYTTAIDGDLLVIVDITLGITKKIRIEDLFANTIILSLKVLDDDGVLRELRFDASGNPYTTPI